MKSPYNENDSGQDLPEDKNSNDFWLELIAMSMIGVVIFLIVYTWAK